MIVVQGESLQPDRSLIPCFAESSCHRGVVDFSRPRFMAARYIRHVNVADLRAVITDQLDHVSFLNLRMVDVEQELDPGAAYFSNQPDSIFDSIQWIPRMVHLDVQRFQIVDDVM